MVFGLLLLLLLQMLGAAPALRWVLQPVLAMQASCLHKTMLQRVQRMRVLAGLPPLPRGFTRTALNTFMLRGNCQFRQQNSLCGVALWLVVCVWRVMLYVWAAPLPSIAVVLLRQVALPDAT
jgi:hypothetical protein